MKHRSKGYVYLVFISTLIMGSIGFFAIFLFQAEGAMSVSSMLHYLLAATLYVAAINLVLGRFAKWFRFDFSLLREKPEEYDKAILAFGKVPLEAMIEYLALSLLFGAVVGLTGDFYGLVKEGRGMFSLLLMSLGMEIAGFIFVLGNLLLTRYLTGFKLTRFPLDFSYKRKSLGDFTVPFFMTITTFAFTFSVQALLHGESGQDAQIRTGLISLCVVFLIAATACAVFLQRLTSGVFSSIISQLKQMTSGEKDLSGRIMIGTVDELGLIAAFVNEFNSNLAASIDELKESQKRLSRLGEELTQNAVDSASAISQIASNIAAVGTMILEQSRSVDESSSAVEEIAKNIESLDSIVKDQAASVNEASASIEEMVGNISTTTTSITKIASQFGSLLTATGAGKEALIGSSKRIQLIAERSKTLMEANKVITNIASQTNLLAMNAAIEAAHAGDAGRGFSVVADEIRHLAETSATQSKKISQEIKDVQKAIDDVVNASRGTEDSFNRVVKLVGETDSLVREVDAAMQEQKTGSMEVLEALGSMNGITTQVQEASREMSAGNATVLAEILRLRDSTEHIKESMDQMGVGARGIDGYANKVSALAKGTMETIDTVESAVGSFKT